MYPLARRLIVAVAIALASVLAVGLTGPTPSQAQTPAFFQFTTAPRYAAIVVDASTGEVLYQKNADSQRYPASISKVMTLYLTFEALATGRLHPNDRIVVSAHAASMAPSKLGLHPGESISVEDAIHAIAVHSANDMAVAMAEKIGGSESRFAAMMTLKARQLGMTNTNYDNASGLPDPRQISTARDIAILSRAVMRDFPQYYRYFSLQSFTYDGHVMTNHNRMLGRTPGVDGLKTGYIAASGFNLAASAVRDHHRLIVVVLGGSSTAARDAHVADLFDAGFEVLHKRAMGQTTTVAQNLFEPAPVGPVVRPPTEEGSGDQGNLQIVLADPPRHYLTADTGDNGVRARADAARQSASNDRTSRTAKSKKKDAYAVQVGAYRNRGQAREELASLERKFSEHLGDADHDISPAGHGYYRARFSGMSESKARRACAVLHAHRQTCEVVEPDS